MAVTAWPTGADTKNWMRSRGFGDVAADQTVLNDVTEAATDMIVSRLDTTLMPVGWPAGDTCPRAVCQAIMMRAASLYVRRDSPTGIIEFTQDSVFRVNRYDSDVDQLISPYLAALIG